MPNKRDRRALEHVLKRLEDRLDTADLSTEPIVALSAYSSYPDWTAANRLTGWQIRTLEAVRGAAVHTPHRRAPWIELLVSETIIGPAVLREVADHNCGVAEVDRRAGYVMADVRWIERQPLEADEHVEALGECSPTSTSLQSLLIPSEARVSMQ